MPCCCPEARPMWIPRNTKLRQTRRPPRPIPGAMRWTNCCCRMPTALRKPVLGICYGLQILNVYRQRNAVAAHRVGGQSRGGKKRADRAHGGGGYGIEAEPDCRCERLKRGTRTGLPSRSTRVIISPRRPSATGLRVVARCPQDGIIEAFEGTSPDHFVLAVQWHPERSVEDDEGSRAIFRALVEAAPPLIM